MKFNCCDNKYIAMIKSTFEKAEHAVQGIKLTSEATVQYPDGQGIVELDIFDNADITNLQKQVDTNTNNISANTTAIDNLKSQQEAQYARLRQAETDIDDVTASLASTNTLVRLQAEAFNASEQDRIAKDTELENKIALKQNQLTPGTDIQITADNVISATDTKYTAGTGIAISDDNVISSTVTGGSDFDAQNNDGNIRFLKDGVQQAILKAGTNVTISADGTISASGGSASATTASEVQMSDGRTVQVAIDSIEDEIGDNGTSGTIQYRLDALESADTALDSRITSNTEALATKQNALTSSQLGVTNDATLQGKNYYALGIADTNNFRMVTATGAMSNALQPGNNITFRQVATGLNNKVAIDADLSSKQDALSTAQINATNSGITSAKVTQYDGYNSKISALEAADVELSKAYSSFSIDKNTAGKVSITMSAVDGMTSASADLITAGDNITINNGVISASGGSSAGLTWSTAYNANAKILFYRFSSGYSLSDEFFNIYGTAVLPLTTNMTYTILPMCSEELASAGNAYFSLNWTTTGATINYVKLAYFDTEWNNVNVTDYSNIEFIGCII